MIIQGNHLYVAKPEYVKNCQMMLAKQIILKDSLEKFALDQNDWLEKWRFYTSLQANKEVL